MKTAFRKSFERDLRKLAKKRRILDRVRNVIEDVEQAGDGDNATVTARLTG